MSDDEIMRHYKMYEIIKKAEDTYRSQALQERKWVMYASELDLAYDRILKQMGSSFAEVDQAVKLAHAEERMALVKQFFSYCFQTEEDHLAFLLKHSISVSFTERSSRLQVEDGKQSFDDIPASIDSWGDHLSFRWCARSPNVYAQCHRDLDLGPAVVEIASDGTYSVQHYVHGDRAAGHRNWRKRCIAHNHWIKGITDRKAAFEAAIKKPPA